MAMVKANLSAKRKLPLIDYHCVLPDNNPAGKFVSAGICVIQVWETSFGKYNVLFYTGLISDYSMSGISALNQRILGADCDREDALEIATAKYVNLLSQGWVVSGSVGQLPSATNEEKTPPVTSMQDPKALPVDRDRDIFDALEI